MKKSAKRGLPALLSLLLSAVLLTGCGGTASTGDGENGAAGSGSALSSGDGVSNPDSVTPLSVYCFDAGKADAFLLRTENSAVLIDAGEKGFGKTILVWLEEQGVTRLDAMIISHFDQDHVGGAARIINRFPVDLILQNNSPKDSDEYEKYVKAVNNASIEPVTVRETYTFALDGVSYTVDPPKLSKYRDDTSNNTSLIVSVDNGANRFLFMGDARSERIEEFLSRDSGTCDVLKVPHHGKEEPLMAELLQAVSPAYAVITSSEEEPEDPGIVETLKQAGVEVYLTRNGPVLMESGETGLKIGYVES